MRILLGSAAAAAVVLVVVAGTYYGCASQVAFEYDYMAYSMEGWAIVLTHGPFTKATLVSGGMPYTSVAALSGIVYGTAFALFAAVGWVASSRKPPSDRQE